MSEIKYPKAKERRERLKAENRCVICGSKLPEGTKYFRCFKCRIAQSQASDKYRKKKEKVNERKFTVAEILDGVECCINKDNDILCENCAFNGMAEKRGTSCSAIVWEALSKAKAEMLKGANNE